MINRPGVVLKMVSLFFIAFSGSGFPQSSGAANCDATNETVITRAYMATGCRDFPQEKVYESLYVEGCNLPVVAVSYLGGKPSYHGPRVEALDATGSVDFWSETTWLSATLLCMPLQNVTGRTIRLKDYPGTSVIVESPFRGE